MITHMKKFVLAGAAALPLVAGAAFAQTAPVTQPATPPAVQNSTTATAPGVAAKSSVGEKPAAVDGKTAATEKTMTDSHGKVEKTHKSAIEKKNAKAHEVQKGAKVEDKAASSGSDQLAKKPGETKTEATATKKL
jgi:hypothetical protein